jgi:hypothetical protein
MTKALDVVEPRDEQLLGLAPKVLHEAALLETGLSPHEIAMVAGLVRKLRDQGLALTGPAGLLKSLTKTVLETALEEELSEHLGYAEHDPVRRNPGNSHNGYPVEDSGQRRVREARDRGPQGWCGQLPHPIAFISYRGRRVTFGGLGGGELLDRIDDLIERNVLAESSPDSSRDIDEGEFSFEDALIKRKHP